MDSRAGIGRLLVLLACGLLAFASASAEDVEKKFRLGIGLGGFNPQDEVSSDSANVLILVDETQAISNAYIDPRNDSAVFGEMNIQAGATATIYGQYAVTKTFIVEASVGYGKHDVGDVEVQAQFPGQTIPEEFGAIDMSFYRFPVGELERVPIQLTGMVRFRPRASFNPYVGAGIGYAIIGFEPSAEFDQLSINLDNSIGGQGRVSSAFNNTPSFSAAAPSEQLNLTGATVDARDTFEWHLAGGAELSFRRNWVLFLDVRVTTSSRSMSIGFNGGDSLGISVPNLRDFETSRFGTMAYGPYHITSGGLVDGGSVQPVDRPDPEMPDPDGNAVCSVTPTSCEFAVGEQFEDGDLDPGFYYVQGGTVDYDGIALKIGVRYTF